jgi:pyrimidine deaminase RibD-like protein
MTLYDAEREAHLYWMRQAISLSRLCPPTLAAYSVGAVIVDADGKELASGFSRDTDPTVHAEESVLRRTTGEAGLDGAVLYSTMEPCSERRSAPATCTELVLASGIKRVVIAWREPSALVADCIGVELLRAAGVAVIELDELAVEVREINRKIIP